MIHFPLSSFNSIDALNSAAIQIREKAATYLRGVPHAFSGMVMVYLLSYRLLITPRFSAEQHDYLAGKTVCPLFPDIVYHYSSSVCRLNFEPKLFSTATEEETLTIPAKEEALFRVVFQELLLKRIPKAILQKVAPSYASIVDHKVTRIARVLLTSVLFSLAHAAHPRHGWPTCSGLIPLQTVVPGLIISTIQEVTGNPILAWAAHAGYNVASAHVRDNLGIKRQCVEAIPEDFSAFFRFESPIEDTHVDLSLPPQPQCPTFENPFIMKQGFTPINPSK